MENASSGRPAPASGRRVRDLVISLVVLLVPVLLLVGGFQLLSGRNAPTAVDQSPQVAAARQAGLPVREPAGLDPGWVPVSASWHEQAAGRTLRLGFVAPDGAPIQVVQSTVSGEQLLAAELTHDPAAGGTARQPVPQGTVDVSGVAWQRYPGRDGELSLVLLDDALTVLVVGPTARSDLVTLAAALPDG